MPRLFVAVTLPDEIKEVLQGLCNGLRGARWARDGQFHVTLRFIGEVEAPQARQIEEVLHGVRSDPFELSLRGIGRFPPRGKPRVVWAGVHPPDPLALLHERIGKVLRHAGVPPDARRFAAHVTLGRLNGTPLPKMHEYLVLHDRLASEPFPVTDFALIASSLSREGALHSVVAGYPLFGRSPG